MKTNLEQRILHKALDHKFGIEGKLIDMVVDSAADGKEPNIKVKNVCAFIPEPMAKRLDDTLGLLKMSKREFLTLAITEALNKADEIIEEYNALGIPDGGDGLSVEVVDVIDKESGPILRLNVKSPPFFLDESEVEGDLKSMKLGDILEKRGDKYVKVQGGVQGGVQ